jgi:acetamidase/formamidase
MRDAFRKMRGFLMTAKGLSEDEAISLMSVAVDSPATWRRLPRRATCGLNSLG